MNGLKQKLASGDAVFGTMLVEIHTPNIAKMLQVCGFDYAIVDCEHGYYDYSMVANIVAVAREAGIPMIVRIPQTSRECVLKYLELGASGILIPMVDSAQVVRKAVEYGKYAPVGKRGVSTLRAHTGYNVQNLNEYMKRANRETMVLAQIESIEGLSQLEDIVSVEGLDGVIAGPNDLSQDMGLLNDYTHPRMQEALQRIAHTAAAQGVWSGIHATDISLLHRCMNLGMQLCSWSSEVGMMMQGAKAGLQNLRNKR